MNTGQMTIYLNWRTIKLTNLIELFFCGMDTFVLILAFPKAYMAWMGLFLFCIWLIFQVALIAKNILIKSNAVCNIQDWNLHSPQDKWLWKQNDSSATFRRKNVTEKSYMEC